MTEPPAAALLPAAASERDVLLATKLHVPGSRADLVPRPRLTERLDEGLERGLVLVCAPAGYGKTVLLADWARRSQYPAGWLSLDAGDNDPPGSGGTRWARWTGRGRGSQTGWGRCSGRPPRPRSNRW